MFSHFFKILNQGKIRKNMENIWKTWKDHSVFEDFEVGKQPHILEHTIVFEKVFECFWDSDKGLRIGQLVVDSGKHMLANSNAK